MKKFTLLELMITVAIMAVIAAMLLPALGAARNKARSAECLGRIRQNSTAMQAYNLDFNGHTVSYRINADATATSWSSILFTMQYMTGISYLKVRTFTCPALPPEGFYDPYRTYGSLKFNDIWEGNYFEQRYGTFWQRELRSTAGIFYMPHKLRTPSKVPHFADTLYVNPGNAGNGYGYYYFPLRNKNNATLSLHHNLRGNIIYFDGHATSISAPSLLTEDIQALVLDGKKME